jgi:lysozyme
MNNNNPVTNERAQLIADEGLELKPYKCTAGKWTIGVGRNLEDNPLSSADCMFFMVARGHIPADNTPIKEIRRLLFEDFQANGISENEANYLFTNDICKTCDRLKIAFPWYERQPEEVQQLLLNMAFNLGIEGLKEFTGTLALIQIGQYKAAAARLRGTLWYRQVTNRADRICKRFENVNN